MDEILKQIVITGAGQTINRRTKQVDPWTPRSLSEALTRLDPSGHGVSVRTTQLWVRYKDTKLSTKNIRLLSYLLGCGDSDATSKWLSTLAAANMAHVKDHPYVEAALTSPPATVPITVVDEKNDSLRLATLVAKFYQREAKLEFPVAIFTGGATIGFIAFLLKINTYEMEDSLGNSKQVGYLWAPNWVLNFQLLFPLVIIFTSDIVRRWTTETDSVSYILDGDNRLHSWHNNITKSNLLLWILLVFIIPVTAFFQWINYCLLPLVQNRLAHGRLPDWGSIAIFDPDHISTIAAISFTGIAFLYTGICSFLFYCALVMVTLVAQNYHDLVKFTKVKFTKRLQFAIQDDGEKLAAAIFRCTILGLWLGATIHIQNAYLSTSAEDIINWLYIDAASVFKSTKNTSLISEYTFPWSSVLAEITTLGFYLYTIGQVKNVNKIVFDARSKFSRNSTVGVRMNIIIIGLLVNYLMIGLVPGFSIMLVLMVLVSIYAIADPKIGHKDKG